ncbi:hypothetical protein Tco_1007064 [Tanacetum coccineum]|uniref:Uncharacterized protein n=1 Tax=Tanacetum coccineum TaxID=301880 RepID=A0ABQ5FJJ4_9ASTR
MGYEDRTLSGPYRLSNLGGYPKWECPVSVTLDTTGQIKILPPKTAEELVLRERRKFGGNDESKKMQKYILKQQFEGFTVSNSDGIHKGYERFQSLLSQLEIHGAGVSTEDANQKFLRSLPSAWLQVSLIMRNKPGMDSLSSTASSSNLQNIAFVSENTNSTNEVSTAYGVSHSSGHCLKHEQPSTSSYSLLEVNLVFKRRLVETQFDAKRTCWFDKQKWNASNATKQGILQESVERRKRIEGEMDGILGIEKGEELAIEMKAYLERKKNLEH